MNKGRFVYYGPEGTFYSDIIPEYRNWGDYGYKIFKEFSNVYDISDFAIVVENHYQDTITGETAILHRYNESMPESSMQSFITFMGNSALWNGVHAYIVSSMPNDFVLADVTGKKFTLFSQFGVALFNGKYI